MTQTQAPLTAQPKKRPRSWWFPWIFVAFFAVIISVNGVMMYFAYDSWSGLETDGHYRKGLAYDDTIAAAKAQEAMGWDVKLDVKTLKSDGDSRTVAYKVTFLDQDKKPVESLKAHAYFMRPTHEGVDENEQMNLIAPGVVTGEFNLKMPGQWTVRVYGESLDRKYQLVERIVVK